MELRELTPEEERAIIARFRRTPDQEGKPILALSLSTIEANLRKRLADPTISSEVRDRTEKKLAGILAAKENEPD